MAGTKNNNWDEPEQAPHLSNGVPRDVYIYVSYVIPLNAPRILILGQLRFF